MYCRVSLYACHTGSVLIAAVNVAIAEVILQELKEIKSLCSNHSNYITNTDGNKWNNS